MHQKFQEAMYLLQTAGMSDKKESKKSRENLDNSKVEVFIDCLEVRGYFNEQLIGEAVDTLALSKPFKKEGGEIIPTAKVKEDLFGALTQARAAGENFIKVFLERFAAEDYFTVLDILDILTYLHQTAFNREYREERDKFSSAQPENWMQQKASANRFMTRAEEGGFVLPNPPTKADFYVIGVMGAASERFSSRVVYLRDEVLKDKEVTYDNLAALTGYRKLSKPLDNPDHIQAVADGKSGISGTEVIYEEESGRNFAKGLFEEDMVRFFLKKTFPEESKREKIWVFYSQKQEQNTRATTEDSAADLAAHIKSKIQEGSFKTKEGACKLMIVAEKPYLPRMTFQIQSELNGMLASIPDCSVTVEVIGCGKGISTPYNPQILFNVSSEMAVEQYCRYTAVRKTFTQELRDLNFIGYAKRKTTRETELAKRPKTDEKLKEKKDKIADTREELSKESRNPSNTPAVTDLFKVKPKLPSGSDNPKEDLDDTLDPSSQSSTSSSTPP